MNVAPKSIFESKNFWVAVIQGMAGILLVVMEHYPNLGYLMVAKSAVDVVLRFLTNRPVKLL